MISRALSVIAMCAAGSVSAQLVTHPAPEGEPASLDYAVWVNGEAVFCYTSYRFDAGSEERIAGRPVSPVSFCYFDHAGEVEVEVRLLDGLREAGLDTSRVVVRPLAKGICPEVVDGKARFRIGEPCQLTVEPGGALGHPLHIFANPLEENAPDPEDANVLYFGPGRHEISEVDIKSGQTVYIAGGAVVSLQPAEDDRLGEPTGLYGLKLSPAPGLFSSNWQKNVAIRGRGILCGRQGLEQMQRGHLIRVQGIEDLTVEGVIIRESSVWSLNVVNCTGVRVSNVKIVGHYVNNDGVCIGGTSHALVEDCFSHNADDSFEVKVWIAQEDVTFRNCVVYNDIGGALGMCCESGAELSGVVYEDCTVLHATHENPSRGVIGIELEGTGAIRDFRFENIVIEDVTGELHAPLKVVNNWDEWHMDLPTLPGRPYEQANPPKREEPRGAIRDVVFRNVTVLRCDNEDVVLMADGPESPIENVTLENVTIAGRRLEAGDPRIKTNAWVKNVVVR